MVDAPKDPEVSLINKTVPMLEALHADPVGFTTVQTLIVPSEMPAPDSVILMPAWGPAEMDCMGVNETVAVVSDAEKMDAREMVRFGISKPDAGEGDEEPAIAGKTPVVVAIVTSIVAAEKSFEIPAATLVKAV